jgi:hypothetical protein
MRYALKTVNVWVQEFFLAIHTALHWLLTDFGKFVPNMLLFIIFSIESTSSFNGYCYTPKGTPLFTPNIGSAIAQTDSH